MEYLKLISEISAIANIYLVKEAIDDDNEHTSHSHVMA
jgi:hypothetical protein